MKRFILLVSFVLTSTNVSAQPSDLDRSRLNQAAFYNYSEQGDITIRAHVWGAVRFPGLYEIPRGTVLSQIISLAGGPSFAERNSREKRNVELKLHRIEEAQRVIVYGAQMKNQLEVSAEDPVLANGDVITIEATVRQGFKWRDVFPVVTMIATLALAFDRING